MDCLQVPSLICDSAATPVVGGIQSSLGPPIHDPAVCAACTLCPTHEVDTARGLGRRLTHLEHGA